MPQDPENPPSPTKTTPLGKGSAAPKRPAFPRIAEVREMLKARAEELLNLQRRIIYEALANQDYETANDANQFLLKHLPPDEQGVHLLDHDIDKPKDTGKQLGPQISIGFALGGLPQPQQLPAPKIEVIDVSPEDEERDGRPTDHPPTLLDGDTGTKGDLVAPERDSSDS